MAPGRFFGIAPLMGILEVATMPEALGLREGTLFSGRASPVLHNCGHTRSVDNPRQHCKIGPFDPTRRVTTASELGGA